MEKKIKEKKLKVVLFGASNFALEFLSNTNLSNNILFLTDSNPIYHKKIRFGFSVISPIKLKDKNFDKIIITSGVFFSEIKNFILKLGIPKNKIIVL